MLVYDPLGWFGWPPHLEHWSGLATSKLSQIHIRNLVNVQEKKNLNRRKKKFTSTTWFCTNIFKILKILTSAPTLGPTGGKR